MTSVEYKELVEFIGIRLDRADTSRAEIEDRLTRRIVGVEEGLTAVGDRLTRVEISHESLRDDLRAAIEQIVTNRRKIEENGRRIEENGAKNRGEWHRIDALTLPRVDTLTPSRFDGLASRFDGLEATVSTRFDDHERRICDWSRRRAIPAVATVILDPDVAASPLAARLPCPTSPDPHSHSRRREAHGSGASAGHLAPIVHVRGWTMRRSS